MLAPLPWAARALRAAALALAKALYAAVLGPAVAAPAVLLPPVASADGAAAALPAGTSAGWQPAEAYPGPAAPAGGGDGVLELVLAEVRRTTRLVERRVRVRQLFEISAFGRTYRFSARVSKEPDGIVVEAEDAPWFLPTRLQLALIEAADLLDAYDPVLAGQTLSGSGKVAWVVEARPRPGQRGAARVRFWVEQATGLVTHLELGYPWGGLVIDQTYQQVGPYTVLDRQEVRIEPLGIRVRVRYQDYWFEPPDP